MDIEIQVNIKKRQADIKKKTTTTTSHNNSWRLTLIMDAVHCMSVHYELLDRALNKKENNMATSMNLMTNVILVY